MPDVNIRASTEEIVQSPANRRTFLTQVATTSLGMATAALVVAADSTSAQAQSSDPLLGQPKASVLPGQSEADTGHTYPMAQPNAKTEKQLRMGIIGPAMLSLAASQIAVDKTTNKEAQEFANFELREAIAVTSVLKSLGTPVPPMDAMARATLAKIKATPKGEAFDKVYMTAQLANHEFLRDLAASYLTNSAGSKSMPEMHGRHLATLALSNFKEHVVHCKKILPTFGA
jgi:predicted outer membrane protein